MYLRASGPSTLSDTLRVMAEEAGERGCLRCERVIERGEAAFSCLHGCTFCQSCTEELDSVCPNCGGELRERGSPTR